MNESTQDHQSRGDPNGGQTHRGKPPYWRRAHRDWRIWIFLILILAAIVIYLLTGNLLWNFHGPPQTLMPIAI